MANLNIPQSRIDWLAYDTWHAEGRTDKAFAESIHMDPNNFVQYKRRRLRDAPTILDVPVETVELAPPVNGNLPAIQTPAHPSASERTSALPVHSDASALDALNSRLAT